MAGAIGRRPPSAMDRCPHCATPSPSRPNCRVCGRPVEAAGERIAPVPGLEPTRMESVVVGPGRLEGLVTTEEELGDVGIPIDEEPAPVVCRRCGAPSTGARFCERCGLAVRPLERAELAAGAVEPPLRCLACGVPNRPEAQVCVGCGQRLSP